MDTFLIITSDELVSDAKQIWGDGSWVKPKKREALEWFMFAGIMGWKAKIISAEETYSSNLIKWVVVACDPQQISPQTQAWLMQKISSEAILVIVRAGKYNSEWLRQLGISFSADKISGSNFKWLVPVEEVKITQIKSTLISCILNIGKNLKPILKLNNDVIIGLSGINKSRIISLGFHPTEAIENNPQITSIIRQLFIMNTPTSFAWLDWKNTMALRMDDPGSSELIHHNIYHDCKKISTSQWDELGCILQKYNAKLSIGYVNGWIDDGNKSRGQLKVAGKSINRIKGEIYPSQKIIYNSKNKGIYDYQAEYAAIKKLKQDSLVQVETHGYTHISPNLKEWLNASTKYDDKKWYREFGNSDSLFIANGPLKDHPLFKTKNALSEYWDEKPMVLIYPGEEFTLSTQKDALDLGWNMISSYYHAIRYEDRFCWTQQICSPYLNEIDAKWIDSEMPFIGYFHDFDLSRNGIDWFSDCIDNWKKIGVKNFIDLRTLLFGLNYNLSLEEQDAKMVLYLDNELVSETKYPYRIKLKPSSKALPEEIIINKGDDTNSVKFENIKDNKGVFTIPIVF